MNSILREFPGDKVAVLVVWEPILITDLEPPSNRQLRRVTDARAAQFWDQKGTVSRAIRAPILARGQDDNRLRYRTKGAMLWDTACIYPAGVLWGAGGPQPAYTGGPVVKISSELRKALRDAIEHRNSRLDAGN